MPNTLMQDGTSDFSSIQQITGALRKWWRVLLASVLVGVLLGSLAALLTPKEYVAEATLYASSELTGNDATNAYQGSLLSEQRLASYVELVNSPRVTQATAARMSKPSLSVDEISSSLTATSIPDTVLMSISATRHDPLEATALADAASSSTVDLVREIERPDVPGERAPVSLKVVAAATSPATLSWPSWPIYILAGAILGLLVACTYLYVREALDTTITDTQHLSRLSGSPALGATVATIDSDGRPLVVASTPGSVAAERFRSIRTNLQFVDIDQRGKVLAFSSPLEGEGKTTTVCNLALTLADSGEKVLIIDADLRRPSVAETFGLDQEVGLSNVLSGRITALEARQLYPGGSISKNSVHVLAAGRIPPNAGELLGSDSMRRLIKDMREEYGYVLLDLPPLLPVADAAIATRHCDGAILLCKYAKTKDTDIRAALESLSQVKAPLLGSILSMVPIDENNKYGQYYGPVANPASHRAAAKASGKDADQVELGVYHGPRLHPSPGQRRRT